MTVDLAALRNDLHAFSRAIGWELATWQSDALALRRRTTVLVAPRQSGKSRSLAVAALWWAYGRPDSRVLIVSAGEDASRRLLAQAAGIAIRSPLLSGSVTDENAGLLVLSNGSEIRSVPASERAVRGWTVDLLLVDEAAQVDDDLLLGAAIPTTAARADARIVLAGSPGAAEGAFHGYAESGERGSEHVQTFHWALGDAPWIGAEVIDAAREQLAPAQFQREYEGRFADAGLDERVIERDWIVQAQRRELEPGRLLYGLDVARHGRDETVLMALRGDVARVTWAAHGADLMQTAAQVAAHLQGEPGPTPECRLDAIGLGYGVLDRLHEMGLDSVSAFIASARPTSTRYANVRAEAWWLAREAFRTGAVDIDPQDRLLAEQLASVRYTLTSSGAIQIASKDSMRSSPDRADALVIALYARARSAGVGLEFAERLVEEAREDAAREWREPTELALASGPSTEDWLRGPRAQPLWLHDPDLDVFL